MSTPELQLETLFRRNGEGRIMSTREPEASPGPVFMLVRSSESCAWGVRADVPFAVAEELDRLAREEPPSSDLRDEPVHRDLYVSLVEGRIKSGPAFTFPDAISEPIDVVLVEDVHLLERNFRGWRAGDIEAGASLSGRGCRRERTRGQHLLLCEAI